MWKASLAVLILKRTHGELVSTVGKCLMNLGSLTLRQIGDKTKVKYAKIRSALVVLVQHGMVEFLENKQSQTEYQIYVDRVVNQIYFHKEAKCAGLLYGDAAEIMVEELLQEGRLPMHVLVDCVTNKLNDAIRAQGADQEVQPSFIQDRFERLVSTHFIKRCNVPVKNDKGKVVAFQPLSDEMMFTLPPRSAAGNAVKVKQESTEGEPAGKKQRLSQEVSDQGSSDDTETYWEVNHPRFHHHFRDQMLVSAVARALESEKAAEIMRTILRHCEKTTNPDDLTTHPVSFNEIHNQIPKDKMMSKYTLEQWLKLMTDSMPEFISKVGDSGGGMYIVNTFKAMEALCSAHIESAVEEKVGSMARRIIQVILKNKNVEQETIEHLVLMSRKESRLLMFELFQKHFLRIITISKVPENVSARSCYLLLKVEVDQVARSLLENSYQSLMNLLLSNENMLSVSKRLLEKQERIEAIMVSLGLPATYAHGEDGGAEGGLGVDEETKEQVKAIMETVTPAEQQQLKKIKALIHHFEHVEQDLISNTIFSLSSYLALTCRPPPPKRIKNLMD